MFSLAEVASAWLSAAASSQNPIVVMIWLIVLATVYFSFYNVHAPFSAPQPGVKKFEQKKLKLGLTDQQRFQQGEAAL